MSQEDVPVLIVGGGGAGLTASMLLVAARRRAPARQRAADDVDPAQGPRAQPADDGDPRGRRRRRGDRSAQHARREHGGDARSTPGSPARPRTTAGGSRRLECWGAGGDDENWRAASPAAS